LFNGSLFLDQGCPLQLVLEDRINFLYLRSPKSSFCHRPPSLFFETSGRISTITGYGGLSLSRWQEAIFMKKGGDLESPPKPKSAALVAALPFSRNDFFGALFHPPCSCELILPYIERCMARHPFF